MRARCAAPSAAKASCSTRNRVGKSVSPNWKDLAKIPGFRGPAGHALRLPVVAAQPLATVAGSVAPEQQTLTLTLQGNFGGDTNCIGIGNHLRMLRTR